MTAAAGNWPKRIARLCATTNGFAEWDAFHAAVEDARLREITQGAPDRFRFPLFTRARMAQP